MRRGHINRALGVVVCALAGCAAAPPRVSPVGEGAYHLSVSGSRYETQADTNLKALSAAADFCARQSEHLMFRESTESGDHSWSPKQEDLTFVCMNTNDPKYMQANVPRNAVIAQQ